MALNFPRRFAATAVLAALALPVLAQQAPAAPSTPPTAAATAQDGRHHQAGERHHGHKGGGKHHGHRAEYRAKHMAALKDQLQLTPAQEPAWTAFTTALQPGERTARLDRQGMDQLTTPERIDRMRALRAQHAAEADRRGEVTKTFYAALTPEQQKTFDAKAHRGHRMGGMHAVRDGHHGRNGSNGAQGGHGGHPHGKHGGTQGTTPAAAVPPAPATAL